MKSLVLVLFVIFLAKASSKFDVTSEELPAGLFRRVIGGEQAEPHEYPWIVNLLIKKEGSDDFVHRCGGSLIDREWVLTAAHCLMFNENAEYMVVLGEHHQEEASGNEKNHTVVFVHINDRVFADSQYAYDIALLKIAPKAHISQHVKTIDLPRKYEQVPEGKDCVVAGWGVTSAGGSRSPILLHAHLPIVSHETCSAVNDQLPYSNVDRFANICAGNMTSTSVCHGDSGGPLVCKDAVTNKWTLQGIVSWGDQFCGANFYNVFVRVSSFIDWIDYKKTVIPQAIPTNCNQDYHYYCKEWKDSGWCVFNFVKDFCPKTCVGCVEA